jgi:phage terminase large subunit GpA-like protein
MASQVGGKTTCIENLLGYHVEHDPQSAVVMYPTIESAERFSRRKLVPMLEQSGALKKAFEATQVRGPHSTSSLLVKDFPGGAIFLVGANSPASLRQASAAVLIADEVDTFEASAGQEGDPLELLWRRGESYPDCVKVIASTPTIENASRVWSWFEQSDRRYWFVPCAKCGKHFAFEWRLVKWPKGKPEEAAIECPHCEVAHDDRARLAMYRAGEWRPTSAFGGIRGYHLNGLYRPWPVQRGYRSCLHQFAVEHRRAVAGGSQTLKVWVNTFLAETWREEAERIAHTELMKRAEAYGPALPPAVLVLTAGCDVQIDRIECEVVGWGLGEESWGIEYKVIPGRPDDPRTWKALDEHLLRSWTREDGIELKIVRAGVDSSAFTDWVFRFTKTRFARGILAVRGSPTPGRPVVSAVKRNNRFKAAQLTVGGDQAKGLLYSRLQLTEPGPGYLHFPGVGYGYDEQFYSGLTAEELRVTFRRGFAVREWHKIKVRNEPLDVRVYSYAMLRFLNPNWTALTKGMEKRKAPAGDAMQTRAEAAGREPLTLQPPVQPSPIRRRPVRSFGGRRGFSSGWRKF